MPIGVGDQLSECIPKLEVACIFCTHEPLILQTLRGFSPLVYCPHKLCIERLQRHHTDTTRGLS